MIIPIRCFTCGKPIAQLFEQYVNLISSEVPDIEATAKTGTPQTKLMDDGDAMDIIGLERYCCRRMMLTHVDMVQKFLGFGTDEAHRIMEAINRGEDTRSWFTGPRRK